MRPRGPSRTAAGAAWRRAAHQVIDRPPVFADPFAAILLSDEARGQLARDPWHRNRGIAATTLRAFIAARSRIAEDALAAAYAAGVRQYVLLGAGLDTFACRNPFPSLRVFEVDHPATQGWKIARLRAAEVTPAAGTAFVPVDFEQDPLAERMREHGFDPARSTAISWLGVVPYLELTAILGTLAWAASVVGDQGHVVFDYGARPAWWELRRRLALWGLARRVARAGEPFRTTFHPTRLRAHLTAVGFGRIEDLGSAEVNARYFQGRADGLRLRGGGHVVIARR